MNLHCKTILILVCLHGCIALAEQDTASALRQECQDKILVLRHSLQSNSQEYDSEGRVLKGGSEGPWTLYGRIKVDEVELTTGKLTLKGHRIDYKFSLATGQLEPFPNKIRMQVTISLQSPLTGLTEANEMLHRVFAFTRKDVVDSVPEFWREYFEKNLAPKQPT